VLFKFFKGLIDFLLEVAETAVLAVILFLALYLFLVRPHQVRGDSMYPTFKDGEYLLTEMVSYHLLKKDPQRGDVIVFRSPQQPNLDFIKRIIALPGEKIKVENGDVFIINDANPQGFLIDEPYIAESVETFGRRTIRDGEIFSAEGGYVVMGDNRERSSDSREWGLVKAEAIVGKVWVRYWPPQAVSIINSPTYTSSD
jgi:signal peptidase I